MWVLRRRGWEISENQVTPEWVVLSRRTILAGAAGLIAAPAPGAVSGQAARAVRNPKYKTDHPRSAEQDVTRYNNYYEFGSNKIIWKEAQELKQRPWAVRIEGLVKQPRTLDIDDLLKRVSPEERVYRHRCVEAWAMIVPWTGFPLAELLRIAEPLGSAKYVAFETAADKSMPELRQSWYPWPYTEGLTIEEAQNELAFLSTGIYGKPMPPQNGGPIRLTVPWKYGFKSGKSVVRIIFTERRPKTFWSELQANEYGFWANVNPAVPHPRWSQATERLLTTDERVPTKIFNGYAEYVAALYTDKQGEKLFV